MKLVYGLLLSLSTVATFAGGIRGRITTTQNEALPYAGILLKGTSTGTMSNQEGQFELVLGPGEYEVIFQYLGFKTTTKPVMVGTEFIELNIQLEEQPLNLSTFKVGEGKEDPAYAIMRKAISKARFHQLQVRSYSAKAYTKASGVPTKIPFLLERRLKKEGIEEGKVILNEAISEITFRRPENYKERVISTRNSLDNSIPSPNQYILASFYNPEVAGNITPLSPKAFAYYKFEYEGFFEDRGEIINKIKVIPKAYGEGVMKGSLYIIEDRWAIHSFDFQTVNQGLSIHAKQLFSPVKNVWLPINQQFRLKGGYLGFAGEFNYVISLNYTQLDVDPNLQENVVVKDKTEKPPQGKPEKKADLAQLIEQQKEFSAKNFRKVVKEYEKEDKKARKQQGEDTRIVRQDSVVIDSMANKRDLSFWQELRPVPLSKQEIKSYQVHDSIIVVKREQVKKDSVKKDSSSFKLLHVLTGHAYKLGNNTSLTYEGPLNSLVYNTVEGYAFNLALDWQKKWKKGQQLHLRPLGRYSVGRERLSGTLLGQFRTNSWSAQLEGGEYVYQFNAANPISPGLNSITTLLFERNFLKSYQKQFVKAEYTYRQLGDFMSVRGSLEYARRSELFNLENATPWINRKNYAFTPNRPYAIETPDTSFPTHEALIFDATAIIRPWQKYSIRNGQKRYGKNNGPTFYVGYRKGLPLGSSDVDYDFIQGTVRHTLDTGPKSSLQLSLNGGIFLSNNQTYFPDYKHFMGNQFFFQAGDQLGQFRMLPYYEYSTQSRYVQVHALWSTRRLLLTQLAVVRMSPLKESLQLHYLTTPAAGQYSELGYGIDGIFRLFRVEVIGQFKDWNYCKTGLRIGTTLIIR
jgi:hypothetical protein